MISKDEFKSMLPWISKIETELECAFSDAIYIESSGAWFNFKRSLDLHQYWWGSGNTFVYSSNNHITEDVYIPYKAYLPPFTVIKFTCLPDKEVLLYVR